MATLAESLLASSSRPLVLTMRSDLTARRQRYLGRSYWVVKEPIGLKYYRFQEEEYSILQMLDGNTSMAEIKERFEEEFAPQKITFANLQQFIGMLHRSGLVLAEVAEQGRQLKHRGDEKRRKETFASLSNVLALRYKGIDPERVLNAIYPYFRWLFLPATMFVWCVLVCSALTLIVVQFDVFRSRLPAFHEFFGPANWLLLGAVLAVTKVMHEFGHGLSCKHHGGECHEMGFMLLVLTPCLYCNVSDSWMLPNKWHRAFIGFAGMYIEIGLASIATLIWWFSEPGMLNHLALRVMFISSVSTILFNGNPLLRFDGYYILADILEVPNLRQKSSRVLQRFLARWCLGLEQPEDPFLPQRNRFLFGLYTFAAVTYRWFVVLSILWFLNKVFEPYGLQIIGQLIAMVGMFGLVVMPLWKLGKFFYVPGRMDQVKMPYVYSTLGVIAALLLVIVFLPVPHYVKCSVQVQPRDAKAVYVDVPGHLDQVPVKPGQKVEAGQTLARLSNLDLELEIVKLAGQRDEYEVQLGSLRRQSYQDRQAHAQIGEIDETLAAVREQLSEKEDELKRLTLVAPNDPVVGTVLPPPTRPQENQHKSPLPEWAGSPFDDKNRGSLLTEGSLLCLIGDPHDLEAVLIVDQGDVEFVRKEQEVSIKLDSYADKTLKTQVIEIAKIDLTTAPPGLSAQAGGQLATRTDASGRQRPQSTSYQARAPLDALDDAEKQLLRVGLRGRAKIDAGWQPLGARIWRYLARTFHFSL